MIEPTGVPGNGARGAPSWHAANQRYLSAATGVVRALIDARQPVQAGDGDAAALAERHAAARRELEDAARAMPAPAALDALCATLRLSPFERDIVVLCAAVELDSTFAAACARAQGDSRRSYPTFSLALGALPHAHWSALSPASPLRRFQLVVLGQADALTVCPLRIDERVLHFLTGVPHVDERLAGLVDLVGDHTTALPASHRALADRIVAIWARSGTSVIPVVQLVGLDDEAKRRIAAAACAAVDATLYAVSAHALSAHTLGAGLDEPTLARLLTREAALGGASLLLEFDDLDSSDPRAAFAVRLADRTAGLVLVTSRDRRRLGLRPVLTFDVRHPTKAEQRALWGERIAAAGLAPPDTAARAIDGLVGQFDLGAPGIELACAIAAERTDGDPATALWNACRHESRPRLDDLAQRIEPRARWGDLVLPDAQREILREIVVNVRWREQVYGRWGFAGKGDRGLGITALFSGASGTGKTMAAEVLANELRLDLYRIDLASVVSKYIGETEKNLAHLLARAERAEVVLLFDEADSLFGKRTDVKEANDRFANAQTNYLLQRIESFDGITILTSNSRSRFDESFTRRLDMIVDFPFPGPEERRSLWQSHLGTKHGLDQKSLNQLAAAADLSGGHIRNVVLTAAVLAQEERRAIEYEDVIAGLASEYRKLGRQLPGEFAQRG
jgi:hypothetical protein